VPDTRSPKFWRVTLPIGFAHPKLGANSFRGRASAPAKLEGLRLHPVPFRKIRGDAAELFHFPPAERGLPGAILAPLALAQASETEANSGRIWCRSEGILNEFIVSKSGSIHKAKTRGRIEFIAFLFSGLRVFYGRFCELSAGARKRPESKRFWFAFA
jgi:hypothetical protein